MSNNYFRFKQFTVEHTRCAMKVGTDGVRLGAWARGGDTILDIGTGSGLIALFMAQRYPSGKIVAIDVDAGAVLQARINVSNSAFSDRITIIEKPLQEFCAGQFGSIVCNPPFFVNSLKNRDGQKAMARHADTLTHAELVSGASRLLADDGEFSVVIPAALRTAIDAEAAMAGLFPSRICAIRTIPRKPVSRYLLAYRKHPADRIEQTEECINNDDMSRSEWYSSLTENFYIR